MTLNRRNAEVLDLNSGNVLVERNLGGGDVAAMVANLNTGETKAFVTPSVKPTEVLGIPTSHLPGTIVPAAFSMIKNGSNKRGQQFQIFIVTLDTADLREAESLVSKVLINKNLDLMLAKGNLSSIMTFAPTQPAYHYVGYRNNLAIQLRRIEINSLVKGIDPKTGEAILVRTFVTAVYDQAGEFQGVVYTLGNEVWWDSTKDLTMSSIHASKTGAPSFTRLQVPSLRPISKMNKGRKNGSHRATKLVAATRHLEFEHVIRATSKSYVDEAGRIVVSFEDVLGETWLYNFTPCLNGGKPQMIEHGQLDKGIGAFMGRVDEGRRVTATPRSIYFRIIDGNAELRIREEKGPNFTNTGTPTHHA